MNERILLADDAPFMRMLQKDALKKYGYDVCGEAADGLEAIEKYEELQPDILILGIIFPSIDGIEVLKKIKKEYPESKVIICSSLSQESSVVTALRYGASDFIVKPFQAEFLAGAVESVIKNTRLASLLNQDTLAGWCEKQNNYQPDEKLSQEQINIIVGSYYGLYSASAENQPPDGETKDDLLKKLGQLSGSELEELLKNIKK